MPTDPRRVKVMADHHAFPVWVESPIGMSMTGSLPISPTLTDRLAAWGVEYTHHSLTAEWYDLLPDWNDRGLLLAQLLADELGADWQVVYIDEITDDEVPVPHRS